MGNMELLPGINSTVSIFQDPARASCENMAWTQATVVARVNPMALVLIAEPFLTWSCLPA